MQAPLQAVKVNPVSGVAVSATCEPGLKVALQVGGQLIADGLLTTVPDPPPANVTLKVNGGELRTNPWQPARSSAALIVTQATLTLANLPIRSSLC